MIKRTDPEWAGTKKYLEAEIAKAQIQLEALGLPEAETNFTRGMIAAFRSIILKVEPSNVVAPAEPERPYV